MTIQCCVIMCLQSLSDTKTKLGPDEVKKAAFNLILVSICDMKYFWIKNCTCILNY